MGERDITPDQTVFWDNGFVNINLTLVMTWLVMASTVIAETAMPSHGH